MNTDQDIHELIVRLFSGEASEEDKQKIESWMKENRKNKLLFSDLEGIWINADENGDQDKYEIETVIRNFIYKTRKLTEKKSTSLFYVNRFIRYAAIVVLVIALPLIWWYGKKSAQQMVNNSVSTVLCAYGDRTEVILPDSSKVWLNSGSKIVFNNNFVEDSRQVYLDGEAFFDIKKNPRLPFIVHAANTVNVKVLGTEFNLKAYPDENDVSITLITGSVEIDSNNETTVLTPGQKLQFNRSTFETSVKNLQNLTSETDWVNGRLIFYNESLEELEKKLERWFDVEIEFADQQVAQRRFSGTLERESIVEVISYFASSRYVEYEITGNKVIFYSEETEKQ